MHIKYLIHGKSSTSIQKVMKNNTTIRIEILLIDSSNLAGNNVR